MRTVLALLLVTISAIVSAAPVDQDSGAAYAAIAKTEGLHELWEAKLLNSGAASSPGVFEFNPGE